MPILPRMACALLVGALLLGSCSSIESTSLAQPRPDTFGLTIPDAHPRLWWNSERLARARTWLNKHPLEPARDDTLGHAFLCIVANDQRACDTAITLVMAQQCKNAACNSPNPEVGVASDDARWEGENVVLTFDWLHDRLSAAQRATLIERWNTYFHNIRQHTWGAPQQYQSNFNWGYMRNEIEWGIATWGESPQAQTNLQHGLVTRWQENSISHFQDVGRGGVMQEGSAYGSALGQYAVVPFGSVELLGRDIYRETNFFREAVFYVIYATLPAPTRNRNNNGLYPEIFPFADDERFFDGGMPARINYGTFMPAMADFWRDVPVGAYARSWINFVKPTTPPHVAAVDRGGATAAFSTLPLDYYAPGPRFAYSRDRWGADATVLALQLGVTEDEGHQHNDVGSWQLWRNGRWMSRETTGYSQDITGVGGESVDANHASAHNVLFVDGAGPARARRSGQTIVRRLESRPAYFYVNADLTPAYRSTHPMLDNRSVVHVEREFVFLRALETLVSFDRIESTGSTQPKMFIAHFEGAPSVNAGSREVTYNTDGETFRLTTLLPQDVQYRPVVDEGNRIGQFRLELATSGTPQSYFLNVMQSTDQKGAAVAASVIDTGAEYQLRLTHPSRGTVVLTFRKGGTSSGGTITVDGITSNLTSSVQGISVSDQGVAWAPQ